MSNVSGSPTSLFSRSERILAWAIAAVIAVSLLCLGLWHFVVVTIEPGQAGVRFKLLQGGTVDDTVLPEGYATKLPWDRIYSYEVRVQRMPFEVYALSSEGMGVSIQGDALYRPIREALPALQREIGPDYRSRIVLPPVLDAIRQGASHYKSHELYTLDFQNFAADVRALLSLHPVATYIDFTQIVIAKLQLPPQIQAAVESKLEQEQLSASYEFKLTAAEQEARRKRIEAIGIRNFYSIVQEALTEPLLTWRGIEATVELARSPNTKVVVVGGNRDQMPLILGSEMSRAPADAAPVAPVSESEALELPDFNRLPSLFPRSSDGDRAGVNGQTPLGANEAAARPGGIRPRTGEELGGGSEPRSPQR